MIVYEVWVPPHKAKFDPGRDIAGCFHFDSKENHLKTNCFKHSFIDPRKTNACCYEGFTYMLQQNGKRFYKGLYVTFKLVPDLKKNTVYVLSYSPLNEGHVSILTNTMLRTYTSDIDECIILW